MQRTSSWLIALLAVAVFAAAGYVVTRNNPVPDAGQLVPLPSSASTTPASNQSSLGSTPSGASASGGGASRVIAFLGDDWTAGVGASVPAKRFSSLLAGSLGLQEKNFGAAGTGYAKTSASGGTYDSRLDALVATKPSVVVVSGGRNDTSDYVPTLQTRIKALFVALHSQLPDATIVAVAPMWGDSDQPAELGPVAAAVAQYVRASGGTYLAEADPIHGHPSYMATGADPDDKGYAAIAAALTPLLRPLVGT